jgi:hypothetical protein
MNRDEFASDFKGEGRSFMLFMCVERRKCLSVIARRRQRGRFVFSSIGDGTHAVDDKKELDNEWEVDGSKIVALLT